MDDLAKLSEKATLGVWEVQDGCSWRRIGTAGRDGDVICPATYSETDKHPDLIAGRGESVMGNLQFIVRVVNAYRSGELVPASELAELRAENTRLREEVTDWKSGFIAFCGPFAERYARESGLPPWHIHPLHYDQLEKAGARMDDFTRAALGEQR